MGRALRIVAAAGAAMLLAAACLPGGDDNASGGLVGTSWTVTTIAGTSTVQGAEPTMTFAEDGTVSGSDGCNRYTGPFRTDGDRISIGRLASTLIGCEPLLGAQAQAFTQALMGAGEWEQREDGALEIRGPATLLAVPSSDDPGAGPDGPDLPVEDLAGTSWVLEELPAVQLVDTIPSIAFGGDGTVSGFAGCNSFNGTYEAAGSSIAFGAFATTKVGCPGPTMLVERTFLAALGGASSWRVDANGRLVIEGVVPLTFGPA